MAQQTAMQALVELMKINDIYKPCMPYLMEIIDEVYLPMEKEQIIEAFKEGYINGALEDNEYKGDDYFNETFEK